MIQEYANFGVPVSQNTAKDVLGPILWDGQLRNTLRMVYFVGASFNVAFSEHVHPTDLGKPPRCAKSGIVNSIEKCVFCPN